MVTPEQIAAFRAKNPGQWNAWVKDARLTERRRCKAIIKMAPPALKAKGEQLALETDMSPDEAAVHFLEAYRASGQAWPDRHGVYDGADDADEHALIASAQRLAASRGV